MNLGDVPSPTPSWLDATMDVVFGPVPGLAADWLRNAIHGGAEAEAVAAAEDPVAAAGEVASVAASGAAGARASRRAAEIYDEPTDYPGGDAPSPWPWLIGGAVLLGVGALVVWKLKKRRR